MAIIPIIQLVKERPKLATTYIDDVAVGAEGDEQTTEVMEINRTH